MLNKYYLWRVCADWIRIDSIRIICDVSIGQQIHSIRQMKIHGNVIKMNELSWLHC